jgi:anaerobic selenocysteine-containing dehydrogenase/REP element-mobilizing transposase RayT
MPRKARKLSSANVYHVMVRGNRKQDIFLEDEDRFKFIKVLKKVKQKGEYELCAYCLMNNHVHLLIKEKNEQISRVMKRINVSYANYFNQKYHQVGHLFQDRYKSEPIEDENYLLAVLNYIHNNPLNASIVKNLNEYVWSSYCTYVKKLPHQDFLIDGEDILSLFSSDKDRAIDLFIQYHHQNIQRKGGIIELQEEDKKYNKSVSNEQEAKQYLQDYFKKYNLKLSNLKEKKHRSHRNNLINYLKLNSNLSIRGVANILGFGSTTVHKAQEKKNREPSPVPSENRPLVCFSVCPKDCFGSCSLEVEVEEGKIVEVRGNSNNPVSQGRICAKGKNFPNLIYSPERLLYPLQRIGERGKGEFKRISWEQALDIIYEKLKDLKGQYGPESVLYYNRFANLGVVKNCAYGFWYQFGGFTSAYGGLCDAAAQEAIDLTYGEVKHNKITDLENSKLIILWGMNPAYTHIHINHYINKAVDRGAKLITVDIRENESGARSDLYLNPRPGTDGCLALGIANQLIENNLIEHNFINQHTFGFDEFKELAKDYPLEKVSAITEIPLYKIKTMTNYIKKNPGYALICGVGVQRYTNAGQTIRAISLLPALTGSIGKEGCGFFFNDKQAPELKWPFFPERPDRIRNSIPVAKLASGIDNQIDPPVKAAWIEQANPLTSNPDINLLARVMNELEFIVVTDLFLTDTVRMADIVLPAASMYEYYDLISGYGNSYIQLQQKVIEPPDECKHESEIYRLLGKKFGFNLDYLPKNNLDTIEKIIDSSNLNTNIKELKEKPYLHLSDYQEIAFSDLKFKTSTGRIEFYSRKMEDRWGQNPLPFYCEPKESKYSSPELYVKYPLVFISVHALNKMNSQFSSREIFKEEPFIRINPHDAESRGINDGEKVKVYNERGSVTFKAIISEKVPPGTVYAYFGWWDGVHHANLNELTGEFISEIGYGTAFHNCLVEVKKKNRGRFSVPKI